MTIFELHKKLETGGIPVDKYYLHGLYGSADDNDRLALTIKKGRYFIEYEIYFREKGEKQIMTFTTEDEACNYFYKRIKDS